MHETSAQPSSSRPRTLAITESERAAATADANKLLSVTTDYAVPVGYNKRTGKCFPVERLSDPLATGAGGIRSIVDARFIDGLETCLSDAAADDDDYESREGCGLETAQERSTEHSLKQMRRQIHERRELLDGLCRPVASPVGALNHVVAHLRAIGRKRGKIDKAIFVALASELLAKSGMSDWARRWTLAAALCPTANELRKSTRSATALDRNAKAVDRLVREGMAFLAHHALMTREPAPLVPVEAPRGARAKVKPDLRNRLRGTRHDSANIRALVAQLSADQQITFCRAAEYDALADELACIATDDEKSGLRSLPPVVADALELVGRDDSATRRTLGKMDNKTRDLLVSDWLQEYADEQGSLPSLPHFSPARIKAVKDYMRKAQRIVRTTEAEIERELRRLANNNVEG